MSRTQRFALMTFSAAFFISGLLVHQIGIESNVTLLTVLSKASVWLALGCWVVLLLDTVYHCLLYTKYKVYYPKLEGYGYPFYPVQLSVLKTAINICGIGFLCDHARAISGFVRIVLDPVTADGYVWRYAFYFIIGVRKTKVAVLIPRTERSGPLADLTWDRSMAVYYVGSRRDAIQVIVDLQHALWTEYGYEAQQANPLL